jgi:hypothetical protein
MSDIQCLDVFIAGHADYDIILGHWSIYLTDLAPMSYKQCLHIYLLPLGSSKSTLKTMFQTIQPLDKNDVIFVLAKLNLTRVG